VARTRRAARTGRQTSSQGLDAHNRGRVLSAERLAQGARDIQELLGKHGFIPGVAGHAAHGNLHFTLVADFGDPEGHKRYAAFMEELVDLVVRKHDGSLKAEHGTGLNMAPFLESEWGAKATAMMWRLKELVDPKGILGPNVILTRNAKLHLENLKSVPQIESVTDSSQCIECGFCEPVCPSRNVTMTPRQRIVLRREMARPIAGITHACPAAGGVPVRRNRDLRRRWHMRDSLSDRKSTPVL